MSDINLSNIFQDEKFEDLISTGFTIKQLYERFNDSSITYKEFSGRFFKELGGSFRYNSKRKVWELSVEESDIDLKRNELPKLSDQLLEYFRLTIETCLISYLNGMSQEEFKRLVNPLIKDSVKDEFASKVTPAVINNLRDYITNLVSEIETNQENLIRGLINEKTQKLEGRLKRLEKKLALDQI